MSKFGEGPLGVSWGAWALGAVAYMLFKKKSAADQSIIAPLPPINTPVNVAPVVVSAPAPIAVTPDVMAPVAVPMTQAMVDASVQTHPVPQSVIDTMKTYPQSIDVQKADGTIQTYVQRGAAPDGVPYYAVIIGTNEYGDPISGPVITYAQATQMAVPTANNLSQFRTYRSYRGLGRNWWE